MARHPTFLLTGITSQTWPDGVTTPLGQLACGHTVGTGADHEDRAYWQRALDARRRFRCTLCEATARRPTPTPPGWDNDLPGWPDDAPAHRER